MPNKIILELIEQRDNLYASIEVCRERMGYANFVINNYDKRKKAYKQAVEEYENELQILKNYNYLLKLNMNKTRKAVCN